MTGTIAKTCIAPAEAEAHHTRTSGGEGAEQPDVLRDHGSCKGIGTRVAADCRPERRFALDYSGLRSTAGSSGKTRTPSHPARAAKGRSCRSRCCGRDRKTAFPTAGGRSSWPCSFSFDLSYNRYQKPAVSSTTDRVSAVHFPQATRIEAGAGCGKSFRTAAQVIEARRTIPDNHGLQRIVVSCAAGIVRTGVEIEVRLGTWPFQRGQTLVATDQIQRPVGSYRASARPLAA